MDYFDLSESQKRTITQINKMGPDTNIHSFKLKFPLKDEKYVKKALNSLIGGNLNLRINTDFMQYYAEEVDSFLYADMLDKSDDVINDFIRDFSQKPLKEIFDAPLYQFTLLKTKEESVVLGRTHHILMDESSVDIFAKRLNDCVLALKKGEEYQSSSFSYKEYIKKEKKYHSSEFAKEDEEFWLSKLEGYSQDWYSSDNLNTKLINFHLKNELKEKLKKFSDIDGVTISPFVLALSAVSLYFVKSTWGEEIVLNNVCHNRDFGDNIRDMWGTFTNFIPIKLEYDQKKSFKEVLIYTESMLNECMDHGKLHFNVYSAKLEQKGIDPEMLSMYSMISSSTDSNIEYLFNNSQSELPFLIRVNPSLKDRDGLQLLQIEYNKDCFLDDQISNIVGNIEKLLQNVADEPDKICDEIEIEINPFFAAQKYFKKMFSKSDGPTIINSEMRGKNGSLKESLISIPKSNIEEFCREQEIGPETLFLSVTLYALSKFTFRKDILISIISNNRNKGQELPFAVNIDIDKNVKEYLTSIQDSFRETVKYDYYPFTRISSKNHILPEFLYAYRPSPGEYDGSKPYKLAVFIEKNDYEFKIISCYNNALYCEDFIGTFTNSINTLLNKFTEKPEILIKDISILEDCRRGEYFEINQVEEPLLNKLFEKQVKKSKDKIALIAEDGEFTYDELNQKANRISNALIKRGVEIEDRIMFMLKRDSRLIATMLGIIKAGCAFIPVDPSYPEERIKYVLEDSNAKYIITNGDLPDALDVDDLLIEDCEKNPDPELTPENLCYLIYTSGSTGKPKGVMLTHYNITNYVDPHPENCYAHSFVNKANKILSITTVSFDVFLHEAFITLMNGLTMVFANDEETRNPVELINLFNKTRADSFSASPSRMFHFLEIEGINKALSDCTVISVAGEKYPLNLHEMLINCTGAEIYNVYGPTETTISCNTKHVTGSKITVGRPLLNVTEKVMDIDGNPLPPGVVGELYVGGAGVARGYWGREELNNEKFVVIDNIPYYKTGDLAREERNGEFSILGRIDNQIKLRGLRIEPGEIENLITKYHGIKSVVVVVKNVSSNDHLCAYITADHKIDVKDLADELKKELNKFLIPTIFVQLDELPQTPNGKTDIRSLPEPVLVEKDYVVPQNDAEKFFADIFAHLLGRSKIGATDNFFDLGGTSLLAAKIIMEAMKNGYKLEYGDIFTHPTPCELSRLIANEEESMQVDDEYSYKGINEILRKNTIENFIREENKDLGNVLLTGATGFLGIHVLHDFLENESGSIYCMLRGGRRTVPEERLKMLLFYYFSENYEELFGSRIHIIQGDITNNSDFEKCLTLPIDTVINCAANVKHFASGTQIEDINIGGVINGVRFSKRKDCKFIQISTVSVAGESVDGFPPLNTEFDEQTLYVGQSIDNKYVNSKFKAERVVLEAIMEGLDGKIMRAGNLMARHSDSEFQINFETNGFINNLKAYGSIGKIPYSVLGGQVELTPIDSVARAILILSKTPKECILFHTYNNHSIYIADIIEIMNSVGLNISGAEDDEFEMAFYKAMEDESKQKAISGLITDLDLKESKDHAHISVVNNYTIQILFRLGYKWPLISDEYLVMFIQYLKEMYFFD